jgi:hypothetical protein
VNPFPLNLIVLLSLCAASLLQAAKPDPVAAAREIDSLLASDWEAHKLKPNAPIADEVFVRRIYLDIAGRIPTVREVEEFLDAKAPDKRARLIDSLLAGDGYAHSMFNYWADVLRLQQHGAIGTTAGAAYILYLKDAMRTNKPYDVFVRELISSKGRPWENGAIGYYMRDNRMPLDNFANTARIFLGTRIECAQCHDHPFDTWKQKQFYEMTAFTYGNEVKAYQSPAWVGAMALVSPKLKELAEKHPETKGMKPAAMAKSSDPEVSRFGFISQSVNDVGYLAMGGVGVVHDKEHRLQLPHDYQYSDAKPLDVVEAKTMFGNAAECGPGETPPEAYARWMTSRENPRFTTVIANRLWKMAFGLALIEPLDEMLESTVPVNPKLLQRLEALVRDSDYDMKACLRVIFNTRAYQSASSKDEVQPGADYHFTGPVLRRMSAEQIWDSFITLTMFQPDLRHRTVDGNLKSRIVKSGKIIDALDTLTPEEVYNGAAAAAEGYRTTVETIERLGAEMAKARAANDHATAEVLARRIYLLGSGGRRVLGNSVYVPAVQRLAAKLDGQSPAPAPFPKDPPRIEADALIKLTAEGYPLIEATNLEVKGYDKSDRTPEQLQADIAEEDKAYVTDLNYYRVPESKQQAIIKGQRNARNTWMRADDHLQPAYRGSYLRIFGQSDRMLIENSSRDASIAQALTLMNSDLLGIVMNPTSQLMLAINRSTDPDSRLDTVYLALFARKPTERERAAWEKAQAGGLDSLEDLIYALLNTRRFIFNQ